jgi:hypothetical protein
MAFHLELQRINDWTIYTIDNMNNNPSFNKKDLFGEEEPVKKQSKPAPKP